MYQCLLSKIRGGSRGTFLSYSAVKVSSSRFSEIAAQKVCITTAVWPPPSPGHERADGRTSAGRSELIFQRILVILFLVYP
jgi:hypothetical protein